MPSTAHASPSSSPAAAAFPNLLALAEDQLRATGAVLAPAVCSGWSSLKRVVRTGIAFIADQLGPIGALVMSVLPQFERVGRLVLDIARQKIARFIERRQSGSVRHAPEGFAPRDPNAVPRPRTSMARPEPPLWPDEVMEAEAQREGAFVPSQETKLETAPAMPGSAVALDEIDLAAVLEAASLVDDEEMTLSIADAAERETSSEPLPSIELDARPTAPLALATSLAPAHASPVGVATEDADTQEAPHEATPSAMPAAPRTSARIFETRPETRDVAPTEPASAVVRSREAEPVVANDVEGSPAAKRSRSLMRPLLSLVRVMGAERSARGSKLTH